MGSLYFWGRSIQEMGGNVVIGRSMYGVVVIDGSIYSGFYGILSIWHYTLTWMGLCIPDSWSQLQ